MTTAVFPDTMVLIHYQPQKMPWAQLVGDTSVEVKVVPRVTSEIDEHKEKSPSNVQRRRANAAQRLLLDCDGKDLAPGVPLELIPFDPPGPVDSRLDLSAKDDRILASILRYKADNPQKHVIVATADAGIQTKAKHLGLEFVYVETKYRLQHEDDPEVVELKKTVAVLEKRVAPEPVLSLSFEDGEAHTAKQLSPFRHSDAWVKHQFKLAEEYLHGPTVQIERTFTATSPATRGEQELYLKQTKEYLEALGQHRDVKSRTFEVGLKLENTGRAPAKNAQIRFETPEHVSLHAKAELPYVPERPELSTRSLLASVFGVYGERPQTISLHQAFHPTVPKFSERPARWTSGSVRHQTSEKVTFFVRLKDHSNLKGFKIAYTIMADNLIEPIKGELSFDLRVPRYMRGVSELDPDGEASSP